MVLDKKKLVGVLPDDAVIFDIGAHHCEDSLQFAELFPKAKIYAFEPDNRAFGAAAKALDRGLYNVELWQKAIGDNVAMVDFYPSTGCPDNWPDKVDWDYSGSVCNPTGHRELHKWCAFRNPIQVSMTTVEVFCLNHGIPLIDFIHADVQGAEALMIKGFGSMIGKIHYLYTEFSNVEMYEGQPDYKTIRDMLPGWELTGIYDDNLLLHNPEFKHE